MIKLSVYFDWSEFEVFESTDLLIRVNLFRLVRNLMDDIRNAYGMPIFITSGYRCEAHNKKIGGVANSQHLVGEACDFTGKDFKRLLRIIEEIDEAGLINYDQMIIYRNRRFIHVSYKSILENRNQKIIKR